MQIDMYDWNLTFNFIFTVFVLSDSLERLHLFLFLKRSLVVWKSLVFTKNKWIIKFEIKFLKKDKEKSSKIKVKSSKHHFTLKQTWKSCFSFKNWIQTLESTLKNDLTTISFCFFVCKLQSCKLKIKMIEKENRIYPNDVVSLSVTASYSYHCVSFENFKNEY